MRLKFKMVCISLVTSLSLMGCSIPTEEDANLGNSHSPNHGDVSSKEKTYVPGQRIIRMTVDDNDEEHSYYFGGFIDENTISVILTKRFQDESSGTFYYTFVEGSEITLPESNTHLVVTQANLKDNSITFSKK